MKRAAFLDRDGVINRKPPEGQYVTRWEEMQILPGVAEAIASLSGAGFCAIVVSNQRCVAKGLLTILELDSIHQRLCQKLAKAGAEITEVYYCPHDEHPPCGCRKPAPGMLFIEKRPGRNKCRGCVCTISARRRPPDTAAGIMTHSCPASLRENCSQVVVRVFPPVPLRGSLPPRALFPVTRPYLTCLFSTIKV